MTDRYLEAFEAFERAAPGPAWLVALRRSAMHRFQELGFPSPKSEDWKHTNVAPIAEAAVRLPDAASPPDAVVERGGGAGGRRLVFVNGRWAPRRSSAGPLSDGMRLESLAAAIGTDGVLVQHHLARHASDDANPFAALSTAFLSDGAFIHVPDGVVLEEPVELVFIVTGGNGDARTLAQPRNLIVVGRGARATILERYIGAADVAAFTNAVTEVVIEPGATLTHCRIQDESPSAFHVGTLAVSQARESTFWSCAVTLGGALVRNTIRVRFGADGGAATLSGLYALAGRQHVDHHVTIDHASPRCTSRQVYKGILGGRSRAVFNGRIIVRRDAQRTDAHQTNKNLLLADGPEAYSKPWLEIFADDVKCSHGAADGQLAEDAIFYLRSRGLGEAAARTLLAYGFANELIQRIPVESIRAEVDARSLAWLREQCAVKEPV